MVAGQPSMSADPDLHDATLEEITLDWATGSATLQMRTASGALALRAKDVSRLDCPRSTVQIEMQSGDVIEVHAAAFTWEELRA